MQSITALPETGEFNGHSLRLALLPDQDLIKEPATSSSATIMTYPDPAHLAQGHRLDEELIMLRENREKTDM